MRACPHCKKTGGYEGTLTVRYLMGGNWGEEWETTGDEQTIYKSKRVKCHDCGKRVDLEIAAGVTRTSDISHRHE